MNFIFDNVNDSLKLGLNNVIDTARLKEERCNVGKTGYYMSGHHSQFSSFSSF